MDAMIRNNFVLPVGAYTMRTCFCCARVIRMLYDFRCVEKWLKGQGQKCPTCNEKAKLKDIRIIYAKSIKVSLYVYLCTGA